MCCKREQQKQQAKKASVHKRLAKQGKKKEKCHCLRHCLEAGCATTSSSKTISCLCYSACTHCMHPTICPGLPCIESFQVEPSVLSKLSCAYALRCLLATIQLAQTIASLTAHSTPTMSLHCICNVSCSCSYKHHHGNGDRQQDIVTDMRLALRHTPHTIVPAYDTSAWCPEPKAILSAPAKNCHGVCTNLASATTSSVHADQQAAFFTPKAQNYRLLYSPHLQ